MEKYSNCFENYSSHVVLGLRKGLTLTWNYVCVSYCISVKTLQEILWIFSIAYAVRTIAHYSVKRVTFATLKQADRNDSICEIATDLPFTVYCLSTSILLKCT